MQSSKLGLFFCMISVCTLVIFSLFVLLFDQAVLSFAPSAQQAPPPETQVNGTVSTGNASFQSINPNASSQIGTEPSNYSTYSNTPSGISLQYPSNWGVDDFEFLDNSGVKSLVRFYPMEGRTGGSETVSWVSVDPFAGNNVTSNDYLAKSIEYLRGINYDFKVIDSKTTDKGIMLSGSPAYQMVYTYSINGTTPVKGMEVGTILDGKAYFLTFETLPSKYDSNLPIIQQMLDTFQLHPSSPQTRPSPTDSIDTNASLQIDPQLGNNSESVMQ